jgi:DNA-binding FadR family transcriptional regulator
MRPYAKSDIPNADRAFGSFGSGNITVELVNRLGREIVSGRFSASDSLPNEGALSSELKISRTAVREVIKMLTAKGLVGSRPRRGTEVRPLKESVSRSARSRLVLFIVSDRRRIRYLGSFVLG